jgi:hypothetical protein
MGKRRVCDDAQLERLSILRKESMCMFGLCLDNLVAPFFSVLVAGRVQRIRLLSKMF